MELKTFSFVTVLMIYSATGYQQRNFNVLTNRTFQEYNDNFFPSSKLGMARYFTSFPGYFSDFFPESLDAASLLELWHLSYSQKHQGSIDLRLNTINWETPLFTWLWRWLPPRSTKLLLPPTSLVLELRCSTVPLNHGSLYGALRGN